MCPGRPADKGKATSLHCTLLAAGEWGAGKE